MKFIIHSIFILLLVLVVSSCVTKKAAVEPSAKIFPFGDTVHIRAGSVVYGLPMTVLNIEIELEKRIEKQGPYARYANDLLGIKDIITQDKEIWSITSIGIKTTSELDPSELYIIETNSIFQSNALKLKKEGLILDLNPEIYENAGEAGKISKPSDFRKGFFDLGSDEYFVNQSDTAFRLVKLDTSFIKIPYLVEKKKQLSIDQLAEKAAKSLLELRDGRHLLLSGEANVFPQDKSPLDEINRLEREYLALFAGKAWTESRTLKFTVIPQKNMAGNTVPIFRFSQEAGVLDINNKTGVPVNIQFVPSIKTKDLTVITLPKTTNENPSGYDKLYYRMPQIVTINVKRGEENLYSSRKLIYQFGNILQLPSNYIIGK
jgi:hypothetical protein